MKGRRTWMAVVVVTVRLIAAGPPLVLGVMRSYWSTRSSNPVRRGVALAGKMGCFACHGELGASGLPDPGSEGMQVPSWGGGMWMMYVLDDEDIRQFILDGVSRRRASSASAHAEHERAAIHMPAYREVLTRRDVEDLVAAFRVLSGMTGPNPETPEGRGHDLAARWRCFSCHGPGGSGGLPNPGSFTGFVPGWYGAGFRDLVRSRGEFDAWVREGRIPRLSQNRVASYFLRRQRLGMPAYQGFETQEVNDLWAYVSWLDGKGGLGRAPEVRGGAE